MRRARRRGTADWLLLAEAVLALGIASAAIACLPFRRLAALLSTGTGTSRTSEHAQPTIDRAIWAIEAAARRLPFKTVCFQKGLALYWMMRRRGIETRLHYGVAQKPDKGLCAHVWVSHAGATIMGGEVAAGFACLATYPQRGGSGRQNEI